MSVAESIPIHHGEVVAHHKGFDVIDCLTCGFKHVTPLPTHEELKNTYEHEYYSEEKPLFIEQSVEDKSWWQRVYQDRYEFLEKHLNSERREILDVGSGPGLFLLTGKERGWNTLGVEPSKQASRFAKQQGLSVVDTFYGIDLCDQLGRFDAVHASEVLEHVPNPREILVAMYRNLMPGGILNVIVPNDFNPLQKALQVTDEYEPWWVAPPHHLNYFDFDSLSKLLGDVGFDILHKESNFPMELFLLMGDNYVNDARLGRDCHRKRMAFELKMDLTGNNELRRTFYKNLADLGIGREVVIYAQRPKNS